MTLMLKISYSYMGVNGEILSRLASYSLLLASAHFRSPFPVPRSPFTVLRSPFTVQSSGAWLRLEATYE